MANLKAVVAEASLAVAPLRTRAWREGGCVQKEVHLAIVAKVGDKNLLHIGKQDGGVACVARKAGVGSILLGQFPASVVDGTDLILVKQHSTMVGALFIKSRTL